MVAKGFDIPNTRVHKLSRGIVGLSCRQFAQNRLRAAAGDTDARKISEGMPLR